MRRQNCDGVGLADAEPAKQIRCLPDVAGTVLVAQREIVLRHADACDVTDSRPVRISRCLPE
jgi:hypothetical protein